MNPRMLQQQIDLNSNAITQLESNVTWYSSQDNYRGVPEALEYIRKCRKQISKLAKLQVALKKEIAMYIEDERAERAYEMNTKLSEYAKEVGI
jgi:hypothetical protein